MEMMLMIKRLKSQNKRCLCALLLTALILPVLASCETEFRWGNITRFNFSFQFSDGIDTIEQHRFIVRYEGFFRDDLDFHTFQTYVVTWQIITDLRVHEHTGEEYEIQWEDNMEILHQNNIGPISPESAARLVELLQENNVDSWDGFRASSQYAFPLDFGFGLMIDMDTGRSINAGGFKETPDGFDEVFPILVDFLRDMVDRYSAGAREDDIDNDK